MEFRLPSLGEDIESADVVRVLVKPNDAVTAGQPLFELETEKASSVIESPAAGRVAELRIKAGEKVKPGALVAVIEESAGAKSAAPAAKPPAAEAPKPEADKPAKVAPPPAPAAKPAAKPVPAGTP